MQTALEVVNAHYTVIIQKDLDGICDKYVPLPDTYVILEGPRLTTTGYEKIKTGWIAFCASPLSLQAIEWIEGPYTEETDTMVWVAGIIRLQISTGTRSFENIFRASFVLTLHEGVWKIRHEHVSVAHPDPYGIGDWLKKPLEA
jgi:ketosteroid isomerase-like protein